MYIVYILESLSHGNRYIGSTQNISNRLNEHNSGKVRYTKGRKPWKLVHTEKLKTRSQAIKREKFLKSGQGRKFLDKILT